jgi:hypothetical protein
MSSPTGKTVEALLPSVFVSVCAVTLTLSDGTTRSVSYTDVVVLPAVAISN